MNLFPRLRKAQRDIEQLRVEVAEAGREAEAAVSYAAERDQLAYDAGRRLEGAQAEIVDLKTAIGVLAQRLGEAQAYLLGDGGDRELVAQLARPHMPRFGRAGGVYQHKMDHHRIVVRELTGATEWSYQYVDGGQAVWHIFEEDLADQYREASADEATVLLTAGGKP